MIDSDRPFIRTSFGPARWVAGHSGVVTSSVALSTLLLDALVGNAPRLALEAADVLFQVLAAGWGFAAFRRIAR